MSAQMNNPQPSHVCIASQAVDDEHRSYYYNIDRLQVPYRSAQLHGAGQPRKNTCATGEVPLCTSSPHGLAPNTAYAFLRPVINEMSTAPATSQRKHIVRVPPGSDLVESSPLPTHQARLQHEPVQPQRPPQQSQPQPSLLQGQVPLQPQAPDVEPQGQPVPHLPADAAAQLASSHVPPVLHAHPASHWQPMGPLQPALEQLQGIALSVWR